MRDEYRFLLEEKVPDEEASRRVVERHADYDDPDVWLALAATQWKLGRLDPDVKRRALRVIDERQGLDLWEGDQVTSRLKALTGLREQLENPQPARRAVEPKWAHVTDLTVGDVIAARLDDQVCVALRVIWLHGAETSRGRTPVFEVYRWSGAAFPSIDDLRSLEPEREHGFPLWIDILKLRRRDADWREAGFSLIGHWPVADPRSPDGSEGFVWEVAVSRFRDRYVP